MNMPRSSLSSLLAVTALGIMGGNMAATDTGRTSGNNVTNGSSQTAEKNSPARTQAQITTQAKFLRQLMSGSNSSRRHYPGPGWTHAQVQRMARKKKNQKANRLAHRNR